MYWVFFTKYFISHDSNFSSSSEIPDTLEISAEEEQKIAKFDEEKKKQRQKKFEKKEAPKNGVPKSIPPPVIRYGAPPPGMPPGIPPPMPPMAGIPPQVIYWNTFKWLFSSLKVFKTYLKFKLPGGKRILVNPKFRNKVTPAVTQPTPAVSFSLFLTNESYRVLISEVKQGALYKVQKGSFIKCNRGSL